MYSDIFRHMKTLLVIPLLSMLCACSVMSPVVMDGEAQVSNNAQDGTYYSNTAQGSAQGSFTSLPQSSAVTSLPASATQAEGQVGALAANTKNALLYDYSTGSILFEKNADIKAYPASLTKLLTASVALRYMDPQTVIEVGSELSFVQANSSLCYIQQGHRLTLYDLLTGMLMMSGNDAAYTIAVNCAREVYGDSSMSDEKSLIYFCSLMNAYARDIGALNSNFVNPDGWHDDNHYSTARDILRISLEAMNYSEIKEICAISEKTAVFKSGQTVSWVTSNFLLSKSTAYYYEYAKGLKTGSTSSAGKCLAAFAEKDGHGLLSVVLGCEDDAKRYMDTIGLFNSVFAVD